MLAKIREVCGVYQEQTSKDWIVLHPFCDLRPIFRNPPEPLSKARFIGDDAEQKAKEYAEWLNAKYRKRCGIDD